MNAGPIGGQGAGIRRLLAVTLLGLLALPVADAAAQKPDDRFTPLAAPTVALPALTPADGAKAEGLTPGAALQPMPLVAPPLSPLRVPGAAPSPGSPAARTTAAKPPQPSVTKPAQPPTVTASPTAPPDAPEPPPPPSRAVVTTADVNLRAAPAPGARVVDGLERGTRLEIAGPTTDNPAADGWLRVVRNGKTLGYVAADYVAEAKPANAQPVKPERYAKASRADNGCALPDDMPATRRRAPLPIGSVARVQADANLRVAPACDAKVADVLDSGERVTVLDAAGSWYKVGRKGRAAGYVGAALLGPAKSR